MTVKQIIEKLKSIPDDMQVVMKNHQHSYAFGIQNVEIQYLSNQGELLQKMPKKKTKLKKKDTRIVIPGNNGFIQKYEDDEEIDENTIDQDFGTYKKVVVINQY